MKKSIQAMVALLALAVISEQGLADNAEAFFARANHFTVRIDAAIERAFIEDEPGVFHGAGIVVDPRQQWILTNAHVVGHSPAKLTVTFSDGTKSRAEKVYVDPYVDVAVIRYDQPGNDVLPAELGCNDRPGVGHPIGAFGHPFGLNFTGTRGVVSGRTSRLGPAQLQIDAPVNGGNSGGPVISMVSGKVIGISTSTLNEASSQNTNFAVPISQACHILRLLAKGQDPSPPELDVGFYAMLGDEGRLTVARSYLAPELVQLEPDDVIVSANGVPVSHESDLIDALRGSLQDVRLEVRREGRIVKVNGRLHPMPKVTTRKAVLFAGMLFAEAGYRDRRSLEVGHDVMVHSIVPGSEGEAQEVWLYDLIGRVDGVAVLNLDHLRELLTAASGNESVQLDFLRNVENPESRYMFKPLRRIFSDPEPPGEVGL